MSLHYPDDLIFGIPEIDEQHKYLFNIYNEFSDSIGDDRFKDGAFQLFTCLEDFMSTHFKFEERLIIKSNYPNAEVHVQEHVQTINQMNQFKEKIKSEGPSKELLYSIKRYFIRILINHVKNSDMRLCRHLLDLKEVHCPASVIGTTNNEYKRIGDILVDSQIISSHTLMLALEKQKESNRKLGEILVVMEAVTAEDIVEACAIQLGMLQYPKQFSHVITV